MIIGHRRGEQVLMGQKKKKICLCIITTTVPSLTPALSLIHRNERHKHREDVFSYFRSICMCARSCFVCIHSGFCEKTSVTKRYFSPLLVLTSYLS